MSLAAPRPAASQRPQTYQKSFSSTSNLPTPSSIYSDEDRFYDLDDDEDAVSFVMEDPVQTKTAVPAAVVVPVEVDANAATEGPPSIPQKHNLRASRLLDAMAVGKLGAILEPGHPAVTTPRDIYLSSEEDASSSADDFSDYDYDSASEEVSDDQQSPNTPESPATSASPRRRSHEVTARVVSVVFSGKPSVIELPRRIGTPESSRSSDSDLAATRKRQSSIYSSNQSHEDILSTIPEPGALHEVTPPSSPDSSIDTHGPRRRSGVLSSILHGGKPKPPFLNIDPFANGSTYSLDVPVEETSPAQSHKHHHHIPYYPKSPKSIVQGLQKTLGTIRRRDSRQALQAAPIFDSPPPPSRSATVPVTAPSESVSSSSVQQRPSASAMSFYSSGSSAGESIMSTSSSQSVTYNDIIKAAKRNSRAPPPLMMTPSNMETRESVAPPPMPESPTRQKKTIMKLRRRSQKIMNGRLV